MFRTEEVIKKNIPKQSEERGTWSSGKHVTGAFCQENNLSGGWKLLDS